MTEPRYTRRVYLDAEELAELYTVQGLSIAATGKRLGVSARIVRRNLDDHDIEVRGPSQRNQRIACHDLRDLYVNKGLSTIAVAKRLGVSTSGVGSAMARCDIEPRPVGSELTITPVELQALVDSHVSDQEIADRHNVTLWAVRRRRRSENMQRPPGPQQRRSPSADQLAELYIERVMTMSAIGTEFGVSHATVRRWLAHAEIPRRTKPLANTAAHSEDLTDETLRVHYNDHEWTAAEIGACYGLAKRTVLRRLHSLRVPVRPSGPKRPPLVPVLDRLYDDDSIESALRKHNVPVVRTGGDLRTRFPTPTPLTADLASALYTDIGLSTANISLLTGHTETVIRHFFQHSQITPRTAHTPSPWIQQEP